MVKVVSEKLVNWLIPVKSSCMYCWGAYFTFHVGLDYKDRNFKGLVKKHLTNAIMKKSFRHVSSYKQIYSFKS